MGILTWIVFGLIAGVLAKFFLPGRDPGGMIVTILIGIAGAISASYLGGLAGFYIPSGEFSVIGIISATVGAMLVLFIWRTLIAVRL